MMITVFNENRNVYVPRLSWTFRHFIKFIHNQFEIGTVEWHMEKVGFSFTIYQKKNRKNFLKWDFVCQCTTESFNNLNLGKKRTDNLHWLSLSHTQLSKSQLE